MGSKQGESERGGGKFNWKIFPLFSVEEEKSDKSFFIAFSRSEQRRESEMPRVSLPRT